MPDPWTGLILALATYRLVRLAGWDTFPLADRIRKWATGWHYLSEEELTEFVRNSEFPPTEVPRYGYRRPLLGHLVECPFCIGFWLSLATWLTWLAWHPVVYGAMPLAISGVVGLIAKNWDE